MPVRVSLTVNGRTQIIEKDHDVSLLSVLRNDLELNGPKFGCGLGQWRLLLGPAGREAGSLLPPCPFLRQLERKS